MRETLFQLFENQTGFRRFTEIEFAHLDAVYASPQQVYGIAVYEEQKQLLDDWNSAADELAVKVQSRLQDQLNHLRWDVYLLLVVTNSEIETSQRKIIENDRDYFRKVIVTPRDVRPEEGETAEQRLANRLPFLLHIMPEESKFMMFGDAQFLEELKNCVSEETQTRLGDGFFDGASGENVLHRMLVRVHTDGGNTR